MAKKNVIDTIAAIATPSGRGGVGVIRVSGPKSSAVAQKICSSKRIKRLGTLSHQMIYTEFIDPKTKDIGLWLRCLFSKTKKFYW